MDNFFKEEGNKCFRLNQFEKAIDFYTKAIEIQPNAILFSNRSQALIKIEQFGSALKDSEEAIKLDKNFYKGYYRRGSCHMALGKYKKATADYKKIIELHPKNKSIVKQVENCLKEIKRIRFEKAISQQEPKNLHEEINLQEEIEKLNGSIMTKKYGEYKVVNEKGEEIVKKSPIIKEVDQVLELDFVLNLIEFFKQQQILNFSIVKWILVKMIEQLKKLPNCIEVGLPKKVEGEEDNYFTICGDTHGQFFDTLSIFKKNGYPSEKNHYLFNGDYVDRGQFSCENVLMLFCLKLVFPDYFHLLRGNHESINMNRAHGFSEEVKMKYNEDIFYLFQEVFNWLPLSAVVNKKCFVCHGGLSEKEDLTVKDINEINRNGDIPEKGIMCDLLWADPKRDIVGITPNERGTSICFGMDRVNTFLKNNNFSLVIRSHQTCNEGYEKFGVRPELITVFSCPNYVGVMNNFGGYVRFTNDSCEPECFQFSEDKNKPKPKYARRQDYFF